VPVVFRESDLLERDPVEHDLIAVEIADFKPPLAELLVPADAVEQFVDGGHGFAGMGGGGAGSKAAVGNSI
jgi:hypothetical protein